MTPRQGNFDGLLTLKIRKKPFGSGMRGDAVMAKWTVHCRCAGHRE